MNAFFESRRPSATSTKPRNNQTARLNCKGLHFRA
jgi:hypothetical protein